MLARLATIFLLAAFASPSPAQQPTFRSEVELIEVPVLVSDRAGRFVEGLTVDDFEVRDDGKRQPIQTFAVVDLPFESFGSEDLETRTDVVTNAHAAGRLYLIVLDDLHINARNTSAVRELVREFLTRHVYRNDLVAIVRTGGNAEGVRELTNDRARLIESLDSFEGRKLPQPPRDCPDPLDLERSYNVRAATDVLAAMTEYLARVRGRKTSLLFVSEGFDYDIYDMMGDNQTEAEAVARRIDDAIASAQRNGVVIYSLDPRKLFPRTEDEEPDPVVPCRPIDTRGRDISGRIALGRMSPMNSAPSVERARRSLQSLTHIAKETGGFAATDRNGLDETFTRIVRENTQYYLLGYEVPEGGKGRRFRRLEVKVRRPDVVVRARPGYRSARGDGQPGSSISGSAEPSADLTGAMESPAPITGLTLRAQAVPLPSSGATEVLVVAEVDGGPLGFSREGDRHVGHLELALLDISAGGRPGSVHQQRFAMRLTAEELERVRAAGVRAVWRVPLPPGRHHLRLAAHDRRSGRAGSVTVDVDVLRENPDAPALAGVLLTSDGARAALTPRPDAALAALLTDPPTAVDRFFDDETLNVVVLVGVPANSEPLSLGVSIKTPGGGSIPLFDAAIATDGPLANPPRFRLPLHELGAGAYTLVAELRSTEGRVLDSRQRRFEVARSTQRPSGVLTESEAVPIAHGPDSPRRAFETLVIDSVEGWQHLWRELPTRQAPPDVDFNRFVVVGVFLGDRDAPVPQVTIAGVRHEAARTVVLYKEEDPRQRSNGTGRPFALAGIRRTAMPIAFERVD